MDNVQVRLEQASGMDPGREGTTLWCYLARLLGTFSISKGGDYPYANGLKFEIFIYTCEKVDI